MKLSKIWDDINDRNEIDELLILALQGGRDKMLKHYRKCNWIYCAVLVLDPRFKVETFKKTEWGLEMLKSSYDKFLSIFKTYCDNNVSQDNQEKKEVNNNFDVDDDYDYNSLSVSKDEKSTWETELNDHLSSPRAPKDTNILQWWKFHTHSYPTPCENGPRLFMYSCKFCSL